MHAIFDVPAPAKLNLFLHITGQKADGYHTLQSAFSLINWCDLLHFEKTKTSSISRHDVNIPLPPDDLCTKAAKALQKATGCTAGVHITIEKKIPHEAGLGGGSSDAASTLIALNRLWALNLPPTDLQAIGLQLGADVPFFIAGENAWVEGIGEKITPLNTIQEHEPASFIVIKPNQGIATSSIFSAKNLTRDTKAATIYEFAKHDSFFWKNDLQNVATQQCPEISLVIDWLKSLGLKPRMSGSGSAVFSKLEFPSDFKNHVNSIPRNWSFKICKNLKVHPLKKWTFS